MFKAFLIKYGEIGIKGKNRHLFEDALIQQIKYALRPVEGDFLITKEQGRIYIEAQGAFDYEDALESLQHVFGIVGICPVVLVEDEGFDKLAEDVVGYLDSHYKDKNITEPVPLLPAHKAAGIFRTTPDIFRLYTFENI